MPVIAVATNRYRCGTTCRAVGAIYIRSVAGPPEPMETVSGNSGTRNIEGGC